MYVANMFGGTLNFASTGNIYSMINGDLFVQKCFSLNCSYEIFKKGWNGFVLADTVPMLVKYEQAFNQLENRHLNKFIALDFQPV